MISSILLALGLSLVEASGSGHDLYNGIAGPARWSFEESLMPNQCGGKYQSPINIETSNIAFNTTLNGVMTNDGTYPNVAWTNTAGGVLGNKGHTFQFTANGADGTFTRPDGVYNLLQYHIHASSEHRVNGRTYAAEFHFVHKSSAGNLAVIGAFVDLGETSDSFTAAFVNGINNLTVGASVPFTPSYGSVISGLKASSKIYRYIGSLTTPPCTEGVKWHVASDVFLKISVADFNKLKSNMEFNARGTMPLYYVGDPEWSSKRKSDYYA